MHLQCFTTEAGLDAFYSITGLRPSNEADAIAANELLQLVGGLPLALVQISEFMNDRGYSYDELLPVYKRSAKRIFERVKAPVQYEHTLETVWEVSFERLPTESKRLLNVLTFFDPDLIPESILSNKMSDITEPDLQFLFDNFE